VCIGSGGWRAVGAAMVVAALVLVFLAKVRAQDAIDVVVSALRNGRVESPVLVRLKQETDLVVRSAAGAGAPPVGASSAPGDTRSGQ